MKKPILFVVTAFMLTIVGCSSSDSSTSSGGAAPSVTPLTAQEAANLGFMREEEKMARDVYRVLFDRWNMVIFSNISKAEQSHMNTMAEMLSRYGIEDPVASDATGSFTNPQLAALYDQLLARGSRSPDEAIEVGILIEETDIADLRKAIDESVHADMEQAYENLLNGSFNHLNAFSSYSR